MENQYNTNINKDQFKQMYDYAKSNKDPSFTSKFGEAMVRGDFNRFGSLQAPKKPTVLSKIGDAFKNSTVFGDKPLDPQEVINAGLGFAGGASGAIKNKIVTGVKEVLPKIIEKGKNLIVGKEALHQASKIAEPATQKFVPVEQGGMGKLFKEVVDTTSSAIKKFTTNSINELNKVKSKITGTNFTKENVITTVNDKISSTLGTRVNTRGLTGLDATKASLKDLVDNGLVNDGEVKLLKGMSNFISKTKDWTDRGILNLKEDLFKNYHKTGDGYQTSNKIVKSIYDGLNEMVGSANKKLKPALDAASQNIKDVEAMTKQLLGTGVEREAKLKALATQLKNGAINADDLALIKKLEESTGHSILEDLKGYANYQELIAEFNKTGKFPTAKGVKTKAALDTLKKTAITGAVTGGLISGGEALIN